MLLRHLTPILLLAAAAAAAAAAARPNIVFILTDDQDMHHGSAESQEAVQRLLAARGTKFVNHYATTSVCCPSRVSLMRGQVAHNSNNTDISTPGSGVPAR